jgi:hypothetical protein
LDHDEAGEIFRVVDWPEFSNPSQTCRNAATKIPKPCAP